MTPKQLDLVYNHAEICGAATLIDDEDLANWDASGYEYAFITAVGEQALLSEIGVEGVTWAEVEPHWVVAYRFGLTAATESATS